MIVANKSGVFWSVGVRKFFRNLKTADELSVQVRIRHTSIMFFYGSPLEWSLGRSMRVDNQNPHARVDVGPVVFFKWLYK